MTMMAAEPGHEEAGERPVLQDPSGELPMALQLLRASTIASTRLQLALARRDRRVAMAALDNLTAIDAEFAELVDRLCSLDVASAELGAIGAWLSEEKAALAAEKLGLACDAQGPGLVSPADRLSQVAGDEERAADAAEGEAVPEPDGANLDAVDRAAVRRWWPLVLLAILAVIVAAGLIVAVIVPGREKLTGVTELGRLIGSRWSSLSPS